MDRFGSGLSNIAQKLGFNGFVELSLVVLLTVGVQVLSTLVVFRCPCSSGNFFYGTVFLLVPALVLLVLGYTFIKNTWKIFPCLCKPTPSRLKNICVFFKVFLRITTTAMVAPVSWIAVALLNGKFFVCARTGLNVNATLFKGHLCFGKVPECQSELYRFPCGKSNMTVPQTQREDVLAIIRAESQVLGWLLIASIMTAALLLSCVARCCSRISYMQLKFSKVYAQKESDLLDWYMAEHAKKLAERNLTSFFQQKPPEPIVIPDKEEWEKISTFFCFDSTDQRYSILHKYVEETNFPFQMRNLDKIDPGIHVIEMENKASTNAEVLCAITDPTE